MTERSYYATWDEIPTADYEEAEALLRGHEYEAYTYNQVASALGWDYRRASQVLMALDRRAESGVMAFVRRRLPKGRTKPGRGETLSGAMVEVKLYTWSPMRKRVRTGEGFLARAVQKAVVKALADHGPLSHRRLVERVRQLLGTADRALVEERVGAGLVRRALMETHGPRGAKLLGLTERSGE